MLFLSEVSWVRDDLSFFPLLIAAIRLLGSGSDENKENDLRPSLPQSYAATVARPSTSSASTVPGEWTRGTCLTATLLSLHCSLWMERSLGTTYFLPGEAEAMGIASELGSLNLAGTAPQACFPHTWHELFASLRICKQEESFRNLGGKVGMWIHLKCSLSRQKAEAASVASLNSPFSEVLPRVLAQELTVWLLMPPSWFPGYSEDGGALRGEVIPEHEFATGPVCLDDENEFPPVSIRNP